MLHNIADIYTQGLRGSELYDIPCLSAVQSNPSLLARQAAQLIPASPKAFARNHSSVLVRDLELDDEEHLLIPLVAQIESNRLAVPVVEQIKAHATRVRQF